MEWRALGKVLNKGQDFRQSFSGKELTGQNYTGGEVQGNESLCEWLKPVGMR